MTMSTSGVAITATWVAVEGHEREVEEILRDLAQATRAEPGNREYRPHRLRENPRHFLIFESYDDEAAFDAHVNSEHVQRLVVDKALPMLEVRERSIYDPLG
jgi:quinol monooxygenase YgiN